MLYLSGYGEKQCSSAFWNGELEAELRELGRLDFYGLMKLNADREKVMQEVDKVRAKSVYCHSSDDCSAECKKRGKEDEWRTDICSRRQTAIQSFILLFARCVHDVHK